MIAFVNIKLKNGEDLVGIMESDYQDHIIVNNPIVMCIDNVHGFYAKSWLLLSKENTATIFKENIMFYGEANDKAIHYYEEFVRQIASKLTHSETQDDREYTSELEEMFTAMLESRNSKLH